MEKLLALLGDPQESLRVAQVVGTNGKGTTALALSAALEEMGQKTGAYLSPHVLSYTERVAVRGRPVTEEEFAAGMLEAIRAADENGVEASQFELLTAGALGMFRAAGLSWAVLEAGLGARYDATTAAKPEAVVLTNVALDHTEYLGETVEEIAREKLASLRPGTRLLLGTDDPRVAPVAADEARRRGARLVKMSGPDGFDGGEAARHGLAPYAARDAGLGLAAAAALLDRPLPSGARRRAVLGIKGALPARFEERELDGVPIVVDGGHNPAGVVATLEAVKKLHGGRPLGVVFGVLRGKDAGRMLSALEGEARVLVLARPEGGRAADPAGVAREHGPRDLSGRGAAVVEDPVEAVRAAVAEVGRGGAVLVVGSLSLAAPVLRWLRGSHEA